MFRLAREVRFALNSPDDPQLREKPANSFAGYPSLMGIHPYLTLRITLQGEVQPSDGCLLNIKEIDRVVRDRVIGRMHEFAAKPQAVAASVLHLLKDAWPGTQLTKVDLLLGPFFSVSCFAAEYPMVQLSQSFEFSASHRLHNPAMSDEENRRVFGKCNNPFGHGHNYRLDVTLRGIPNEHGILIDLPTMERTVSTTIIDRFDHKNLNAELPEFREVIPSVENIAQVIYRLLKPQFTTGPAKLARVTVWETSKTSCEYQED